MTYPCALPDPMPGVERIHRHAPFYLPPQTADAMLVGAISSRPTPSPCLHRIGSLIPATWRLSPPMGVVSPATRPAVQEILNRETPHRSKTATPGYCRRPVFEPKVREFVRGWRHTTEVVDAWGGTEGGRKANGREYGR